VHPDQRKLVHINGIVVSRLILVVKFMLFHVHLNLSLGGQHVMLFRNVVKHVEVMAI
jgi:hypothetical protein